MLPGLVIVDATFLRHLASERALARLEAACRLADLRIWPSAINAVEALKHTNESQRERLVAALRRWTQGRPLLPWPPVLLARWVRAAARGERQLQFRGTRLDALLEDPGAIDDGHAKAQRLAATMEARFAAAHAAVRPEVQAELKRRGLRGQWGSCQEFVVEQWSRPDLTDYFGALLWRQLGMLGEPPREAIAASEAWRIAIDAFGAAVYQRVVAHQQVRNPAGLLDLSQLITLALHHQRRIFVTDDGALHDAATAVLVGRYPNARVMRAEELLG